MRRWALVGITVLIVLAGVLPYLQTLRFGLTLDDANTICGHKGVQGPLAFDDLVLRDWWGRSRFDSIGTWRPLATLTFWVDRHIGGGSATTFHLTNVVLYGALLVLLDRFLRRWAAAVLSDAGRSMAVLVFGTLAIHADVVPSPTGRAELLAALLSLAALFAATCGRTLGPREATLAAGFLFLALLSKESAAPMAVLVPFLAHRAHFAARTFRRGALVGLAVASPVTLAIVGGFRVLRMPFMELGPERALENPLLAVDLPRRLVGSLDVLGLYVSHMLTGQRLAPDYSFSEPPVLRDGVLGIALGGLTIAACTLLGLLGWRRSPRVADAALAFGASYLTVSNVVVAASAIADRLFFFPSMWLVVLAALLVDRAARTPALRALACAVALAFSTVQATRGSAYASGWRDDLTLLYAAARTYPNVFRTQRNLAHAFADAHRDEEAAWHLAIAEAIHGSYPVPVSRQAILPSWDDQPFESRLAHLGDSFGTRAACDAVTRASFRLRAWESSSAAALLISQSHRTCGP